MISSLPLKHRLLIAGLATFLTVMLLIPSDPAEASKNSETPSLEVGKRYSLAVPMPTENELAASNATLPHEDNSLDWVSVLRRYQYR